MKKIKTNVVFNGVNIETEQAVPDVLNEYSESTTDTYSAAYINENAGGIADLIIVPTGDGNAVTSLSYDLETGEMTVNKGEEFVKTSDVDNTLSTMSENPVQNKVIAALVPSQASSENQLADKNFVNSSIASNTANFIGTFENVSALNSYSGTITNNDYAFVINSVVKDNGNDWANFNALNLYDKTLLTNFDYAWVINGSKFDLYRFDIVDQVWDQRATNIHKTDVTLNTAYNRYKATVSGSTVTWSFEYTLNNSSFTANQWATINSGLTAADKTKLDGIEAGAEVNDIDSISVDNVAVSPDGNKNVNIDVSSKLAAKKGTGAPTTSTVADFEGQLYLDTTNNNTYQCTAITAQGTTPETYTYTWVKLIRSTDAAGYNSPGVVAFPGVPATYGINSMSYGGNSLIIIEPATNANITLRDTRAPIIPTNLNFAVKSALSDTNHLTMTAAEQETAQEVIGIQFGLLRWDE